MAARKPADEIEASQPRGSSPSAVLGDGGALRRHTLMWLSQLVSRRSVYPLFRRGFMGLPFAHRVAWRVFWNKLCVFWWFAKVEAARRGRTPLLEEMATRLSNDPSFGNLWRTEGLGYYAAMTALHRKVDLHALLGRNTQLPCNCLVPFHLGIGMASSIVELQAAAREDDDRRLQTALAGLHEHRDNAMPGLERVVFEPLGFVAVNYYRPLIPRIDEILSRLDPELSDYFWHGIGRGLYFRPDSFLPYRNLGWHALETVRRLAPDDQKRAQCLTGLSFATTLINIRHPRHLEILLAGHDNEFDDSGAVTSGVKAAIVVWYCWSQESKLVDVFCEFEPRTDAVPIDRWQRLVSEPCRLAMAEDYPKIVRSECYEHLFRYHKDCCTEP